MRYLSPSELFSKGHDAMLSDDFLAAEKYFLASLLEYSKTKEDYIALLGSLDKLALYLYPAGHFENRDIALNFFECFSRVDCNVSLGYVMALLNGVFGDADYSTIIRQVSQLHYGDRIYILGRLLYEGELIRKDDHKAAVLLKSKHIDHRWREHAKKLYYSIGVTIDLPSEDLEDQVDEIINDILKEYNAMIEEQHINKDTLVVEFFKNERNIPDVDTRTNEELPVVNTVNDYEMQVRALVNIFEAASLAPVFKENPKYCEGRYNNMIPYISYGDVMSKRYIIRARPVGNINSFDSEEREVIVQYNSIDDLVKDGWRLD